MDYLQLLRSAWELDKLNEAEWPAKKSEAIGKNSQINFCAN